MKDYKEIILAIVIIISIVVGSLFREFFPMNNWMSFLIPLIISVITGVVLVRFIEFLFNKAGKDKTSK